MDHLHGAGRLQLGAALALRYRYATFLLVLRFAKQVCARRCTHTLRRTDDREAEADRCAGREPALQRRMFCVGLLIDRTAGDAGLLRFMKRRAEAARLMDLWGFCRVTVLRYSDGTEECSS